MSENNTNPSGFKITELGPMPEEWGVKKLIEVAEKYSDIVGGPFGSNLKVSDYTASGVPIIRLQNIERNQFINIDIKYISEGKAEELSLFC
jgi:type I restriction enzyme S subunit